MKKKATLFFPACMLACAVHAQTLEVIGAAGQEAENTDIQLSYTVGELVVETGSADSTTVTQGYHQSNLVVTGISEAPERLDLSIYPNPASDVLILESPSLTQMAAIDIYDSHGALVRRIAKPHQTRIEISLADLSAGSYFLVASHPESAEPFRYKIIKTL